MRFRRYNILLLLTCIALLASSCGTPAKSDSEIATAVAQTVQAQNSLTEVPALPTLTPAPALQATSTPEPGPTSTPGQVSSNPGCTVSAVLVGENPPDDTAFLPGEYFWKTWTFVNTGTCVWDTSYSLVFWSGEGMGGLPSYPLTEVVQPNETMDISIYLQAPATEGSGRPGSGRQGVNCSKLSSLVMEGMKSSGPTLAASCPYIRRTGNLT